MQKNSAVNYFLIVFIFRWGTYLCMSLFSSIRLSIFCSPYLRNCTSCDHKFWYTFVKWWYLQAFFSFFQNFDFVVCWVKRQKVVQNDKKFRLWCIISQEPCIIWFSWYMCVKWYYLVSLGVFSIFSKFWFSRLLRGAGNKRAKNSAKWQKILSVALRIIGTIHHMIVIYGTQV